MTPNPLLVAAAVTYGVAGVILTFAADEVLRWMGIGSSPEVTWMAQLLGAALFALAFLNWFLRFTVVGGIQGRALLVTNLAFLVIALFATLGQWQAHRGSLFAAATVILGLLGAMFAFRLFARAPTPTGTRQRQVDGPH